MTTNLGLPTTRLVSPLPAGRRKAPPLLGTVIAASAIAALLIVSFVPVGYSPTSPSVDILQAPSAAHLFGTDQTGFDMLARTLAAAHVDIPLALAGTLLALLIGTPLGLLASTGGRGSAVIMRILDGFQAFPLLILILVIATLTGGGLAVIVLCIMLVNLPPFIRLSRAEALAVNKSRYVLFAMAIGAPRAHIVRRHLLPQVSGVLLAQASLGSAMAIAVIAAMSFLGVGIAPPTASWGEMISAGASGIGSGQWWPVVFPAAALGITIFCLNVIADGLDAHFSRAQS
jgi:peptide/nickel transport system permease protein